MGLINVIKPLLSPALSSSRVNQPRQHQEFRIILGNTRNQNWGCWVQSENAIYCAMRSPLISSSWKRPLVESSSSDWKPVSSEMSGREMSLRKADSKETMRKQLIASDTKIGHSGPLFLCFRLFYLNVQLVDKILPMLGFEL